MNNKMKDNVGFKYHYAPYGEWGGERVNCCRYFTSDVAHTGCEEKVTCLYCIKNILKGNVEGYILAFRFTKNLIEKEKEYSTSSERISELTCKLYYLYSKMNLSINDYFQFYKNSK